MIKIVKPNELKLGHTMSDLIHILNKEFIIGNKFKIGGVFKDAALELGFGYESDGGAGILIDTNPRDYTSGWSKEYECCFAKQYIEDISKVRDLFRNYVNTDLIEEAYVNIASGIYSYSIKLDELIDTVYLRHIVDMNTITIPSPIRQYSFQKKFNTKPYDTALIKSEFDWLIDELVIAGYEASWHTTPNSIRINITLPKEDD